MTDPGHTIRSIMGAPLFALLSGYGCCVVAKFFRSPGAKRAFLAGSVSLLGISFAVYCKFYFLDYPKYSARWWQYGMKEAIASAEKSRYRCVIVSDRAFFHPPYIFVLFYTQYPPSDYQRLPLDARPNLWRYTLKSDTLIAKKPCG